LVKRRWLGCPGSIQTSHRSIGERAAALGVDPSNATVAADLASLGLVPGDHTRPTLATHTRESFVAAVGSALRSDSDSR
jgi:hypothetical protein